MKHNTQMPKLYKVYCSLAD